MVRRAWVLGAAVLLSLSSGSLAARKADAEKPIQVRLEPKFWTAVIFPEPIATVMIALRPDPQRPDAPAAQQALSMQYHENVMGLLLNEADAVGRMIVIGESRMTYTVQYKYGSPADDKVEVVSLASAPDQQAVPWTPASLMRALKLGTAIPGAVPAHGPAPTGLDARLRLVSVSGLAIGASLGLVLTLENTTDQALLVDSRVGRRSADDPQTVTLDRWTWPAGFTIDYLMADPPQIPPQTQGRILLTLTRRGQ